MKYKIKNLVRGTRIITGEEAKQRRALFNIMQEVSESKGFGEIILPLLEKQEIYTNKAGNEILNQMYTFPDKKGRELCLRPEGTATIQLLANEHFKTQKDVKLWYFTQCYRYERPQKGRYREFYQFGLEWINPSNIGLAKDEFLNICAEVMVLAGIDESQYKINDSVKRGLNYYTTDGFEIEAPELGSQKQILGGGEYKEGIGMAFGFDRIMLMDNKLKNDRS